MASVSGQEKMTVRSIFEEKGIQIQNEIELRNDERTYWWPDSIVYCDYLGEPASKSYYDKENRTSTWVRLENGNWVSDEFDSDGFGFLDIKPIYRVGDDGSHYFSAYGLWWGGSSSIAREFIAKTVYDKNNLVSLEFSLNSTPTVVHAYIIKYTEKNNPVSVDYYFYNSLYRTRQYEYNENDQCTRISISEYNEDKKTMELNRIESIKFDEKGRPIEGHDLWLKSGQSTQYIRFYYSDGANIPNIEIDNNNPIGNDNKGSFDLDINIPVDSISNGSIIITFPEGFTLDDKNTNLTLDFAGNYTLTITKQENNSWLLEIKPKTLKSASLRADELKKMLQVAYTVDEKLQRGTYNISVNSILFETKGGNYIPEPAIIVQAAVNRWGVGNELTVLLSPTVYVNAQTLYIQTENAEQIAIYSITGNKLYETAIHVGLNAINAAHIPQGLYIVKGSSGWAKKVFFNN